MTTDLIPTTSVKFYKKYQEYCEEQGITPLDETNYRAAVSFGNAAIKEAVVSGEVVALPSCFGFLKGGATNRKIFADEEKTTLKHDLPLDWGHFYRTGEKKHFLDKSSMKRYTIKHTKVRRQRYRISIYQLVPVRPFVAELARRCVEGKTVLPL